MNSVEDFLLTLAQLRRWVCPEVNHLPSIQDIQVILLCSGLNGGDFLVSDDFANVVVGDVSKVGFPDEKARVWCNGVYVFFELISAVRLCDLHPYNREYVPIPRHPECWGHSTMP